MITALKNFRTFDLAMQFHQDCKQIKLSPQLRDQLSRATQGIVLTLAEGSAKPTAKDRAKYYAMALGSFRESQIILALAEEKTTLKKYDHLGAFLYKLHRSSAN